MNRMRQKAHSETQRISVSFSFEKYRELQNIAHKKKVSLAWVVRDAVDRYLDDKYPLFSDEKY